LLALALQEWGVMSRSRPCAKGRSMRPTVKPVLAFAGLVALCWLSLATGQVEGSKRKTQAHIERLGAAAWHEAGNQGQGVKVAILDADFFGYRRELGKTLPRSVKARSFRKDGSLEARRTGHGLRTAQIVHALAPRAELLLANWES